MASQPSHAPHLWTAPAAARLRRPGGPAAGAPAWRRQRGAHGASSAMPTRGHAPRSSRPQSRRRGGQSPAPCPRGAQRLRLGSCSGAGFVSGESANSPHTGLAEAQAAAHLRGARGRGAPAWKWKAHMTGPASAAQGAGARGRGDGEGGGEEHHSDRAADTGSSSGSCSAAAMSAIAACGAVRRAEQRKRGRRGCTRGAAAGGPRALLVAPPRAAPHRRRTPPAQCSRDAQRRTREGTDCAR